MFISILYTAYDIHVRIIKQNISCSVSKDYCSIKRNNITRRSFSYHWNNHKRHITVIYLSHPRQISMLTIALFIYTNTNIITLPIHTYFTLDIDTLLCTMGQKQGCHLYKSLIGSIVQRSITPLLSSVIRIYSK